jgi:hypothetical protein
MIVVTVTILFPWFASVTPTISNVNATSNFEISPVEAPQIESLTVEIKLLHSPILQFADCIRFLHVLCFEITGNFPRTSRMRIILYSPLNLNGGQLAMKHQQPMIFIPKPGTANLPAP